MISADEFHGRSFVAEDAAALALTGHPSTRLYLLRPNASTTFDLPEASFLTKGWNTVCVVNDASGAETITIRDNGGSTLVGREPGASSPANRDPFLINPGELAYCSLIENDDADGTWHVKAAVAGAAPGGLPSQVVYLMGHDQQPNVDSRIDEYRQDLDQWSYTGSTLSGNHTEGVTFSLGVSGYIAGGAGAVSSLEGFDPNTVDGGLTNIPAAHQRAFGGQNTADDRGYITVFSVGGAAWYEYDPVGDSWSTTVSFPSRRELGFAGRLPDGLRDGRAHLRCRRSRRNRRPHD